MSTKNPEHQFIDKRELNAYLSANKICLEKLIYEVENLRHEVDVITKILGHAAMQVEQSFKRAEKLEKKRAYNNKQKQEREKAKIKAESKKEAKK
jgi:hypothetical protein